MTAPLVVIDVDTLRAVVREAVRAELDAARAQPALTACDWIGADDVAALVGVSRAYVRRLDVPRYGSRRTPRFRRSEVEAWIAARPSR